MTKMLLLDAHYTDKISLDKKVISLLEKKQTKKLALFASVQFLNVDTVKKQLNDLGIEVLTTNAKRTSVNTQILGCDADSDSFQHPIIQEANAILYIGDGLFHPKAILLSQRTHKEIKDVITWNPISKQIHILTKKDVELQIKKNIANIKRYIASSSVGILVTTKPGQEHFKLAQLLRETIEAQGKKAFLFVDNNVPLNEFENYPFIDAWVNTACTRIGLDDIVGLRQCLINVKDALHPIKVLENLQGR